MSEPDLSSLPSPEECGDNLARRSLLDFVPWATPVYSAPRHLARLVDRLEAAARGETVRVVCHAPPRHAKTETVLHFLAWALWQWPELNLSYSTYADRLSRSKSRKARQIAERIGVQLATDSRSVNEWRTTKGGGLLAGGVGGPLTGHGVNVAIIDDPVKNRIEAESPVKREHLVDWAHDVLTTRVEPGGSIFCFMTRWHPDDLSGVLLGEDFEDIHLPAISDDGAALWPERWSIEELERKKKSVGLYTWDSLYQGRPRSRGAAIFDAPKTYSRLPEIYRAAGGLDLAYSAKKSSDHSCFVKAVAAGDVTYIVDVVRRQVRAPAFKSIVFERCKTPPKVRTTRWYTSTTEQGSGDLFGTGDDAVTVRSIIAKGDKFIRSMRYASRWNQGLVLVPEDAPWLEDFIVEHMAFTGLEGGRDDQVDAAVAADDELEESSGPIDPEPTEATEQTGLRALRP